jgi:hypothetical protein
MMVADVDDNTAKATTGFGRPKTPDLDQPEMSVAKAFNARARANAAPD